MPSNLPRRARELAVEMFFVGVGAGLILAWLLE